MQGGNFFDDIGRSVFPIAKEIGKEVAVPIAKEALTSYMKGSGIRKPTKNGRGRPRNMQGGNFFDDIGRSVFPIGKEIGKELYPVAKEVAVPIAKEALTSYMKGSGIRKPTKRNLMVKELMLKHHMSLPEASKYIKEHNLA